MHKEHIKLSPVYCECLSQVVVQQRLTGNQLKRAKAILMLHQGKTYQAVSQTLQICNPTLRRWVGQFNTDPLSFLASQSQPAPSSVQTRLAPEKQLEPHR